MSTDIVPFERQQVLAEAFAKSKLFGVTDTNQALALMALCEAQGLHPANAVQEYHIINGRPSLKADAMLTRFQRSGGRVEFITYTDEKCEARFSHPQGGQLTVDWDMARAKRAGLTSQNWQKYPRQMLRARVISEGVRTLFPGVLDGMYSPEEVQDFEPDVKSFRVSPRPEEKAPVDRVEVEVQNLLRWVEMRPVPAEQIVEWWDGIKSDEPLAVGVKDRMTQRYPDAYKIVSECIATAQAARRAARERKPEVTDAEIVQ